MSPDNLYVERPHSNFSVRTLLVKHTAGSSQSLGGVPSGPARPAHLVQTCDVDLILQSRANAVRRNATRAGSVLQARRQANVVPALQRGQVLAKLEIDDPLGIVVDEDGSCVTAFDNHQHIWQGTLDDNISFSVTFSRLKDQASFFRYVLGHEPIQHPERFAKLEAGTDLRSLFTVADVCIPLRHCCRGREATLSSVNLVAKVSTEAQMGASQSRRLVDRTLYLASPGENDEVPDVPMKCSITDEHIEPLLPISSPCEQTEELCNAQIVKQEQATEEEVKVESPLVPLEYPDSAGEVVAMQIPQSGTVRKRSSQHSGFRRLLDAVGLSIIHTKTESPAPPEEDVNILKPCADAISATQLRLAPAASAVQTSSASMDSSQDVLPRNPQNIGRKRQYQDIVDLTTDGACSQDNVPKVDNNNPDVVRARRASIEVSQLSDAITVVQSQVLGSSQQSSSAAIDLTLSDDDVDDVEFVSEKKATRPLDDSTERLRNLSQSTSRSSRRPHEISIQSSQTGRSTSNETKRALTYRQRRPSLPDHRSHHKPRASVRSDAYDSHSAASIDLDDMPLGMRRRTVAPILDSRETSPLHVPESEENELPTVLNDDSGEIRQSVAPNQQLQPSTRSEHNPEPAINHIEGTTSPLDSAAGSHSMEKRFVIHRRLEEVSSNTQPVNEERPVQRSHLSNFAVEVRPASHNRQRHQAHSAGLSHCGEPDGHNHPAKPMRTASDDVPNSYQHVEVTSISNAGHAGLKSAKPPRAASGSPNAVDSRARAASAKTMVPPELRRPHCVKLKCSVPRSEQPLWRSVTKRRLKAGEELSESDEEPDNSYVGLHAIYHYHATVLVQHPAHRLVA